MDRILASSIASKLVRKHPKLANDPRVGRAVDLAVRNHVLPLSGHYMVISSDGFRNYRVNVSEKSCTCPDSAENGNICKHRIATAIYIVAHRDPQMAS